MILSAIFSFLFKDHFFPSAELKELRASRQQLDRIRQPLTDATVEYWIGLPLDDIKRLPYFVRFSSEITNTIHTISSSSAHLPSGICQCTWASPERTNINTLEFSNHSLAPSPTNEEFAYEILGHTHVDFEVYKKPIPIAEHPSALNSKSADNHSLVLNSNLSNLRIGLFTSLAEEDGQNEPFHCIGYQKNGPQLWLHARSITADPAAWTSDGSITSVPDLLGAQLFFSLPSGNGAQTPSLNDGIDRVRKKFSLRKIRIKFGWGIELVIREEQMTKLNDKDGFPLYTITLPKSLQELGKLSERVAYEGF